MTAVTLVDSTLRDGSHAKRHQFSVAEVAEVATALDRAGVPVIEVAHGDGLGGSSFNYGFSAVDELELVRAAAGVIEHARIAVLLIPGIGVKSDLVTARDAGASFVRIATHCTEADIAESHIAAARALGYTTAGFLMMAHSIEPAALAEQAAIMADAGAEIVYVTDSAGALVPDGVRGRIAALRERLPESVEVGFHGHQNLSLAVGNSLAAVAEGATWIDCCTCGLGAGAGNAPTEALVAALERGGIDTGVDVFAIIDAAEEVVRPIMLRPLLVDRDALTLGYAGVYSSFLLHAQRASDQFGVPAHEILLEAGRRGAVGGQEDMIVDIAAGLARASAGAAA